MIYSIKITKRAHEDMRGIYAYLAFELGATLAAKKQLSNFEKFIHSLEQLPERYPIYPRKLQDNLNVRVMPCGNYFIIYLFDKLHAEVVVLRVVYSKRDMTKI